MPTYITVGYDAALKRHLCYEKNADPFPEICADYALQIDTASDNSDAELMRKLLGEAEAFLENHSDAIYALLYYSLGTAYGNLRTPGFPLAIHIEEKSCGEAHTGNAMVTMLQRFLGFPCPILEMSFKDILFSERS